VALGNVDSSSSRDNNPSGFCIQEENVRHFIKFSNNDGKLDLHDFLFYFLPQDTKEDIKTPVKLTQYRPLWGPRFHYDKPVISSTLVFLMLVIINHSLRNQ
jgi:hypothetical protein